MEIAATSNRCSGCKPNAAECHTRAATTGPNPPWRIHRVPDPGGRGWTRGGAHSTFRAVKIFAYGSNMCTARLRARVSSARPVGVAWLAGHALRFHKRGWRDGSGKGDAFATRANGARVWGVVFRIDPAQKADLDSVEGLGRGYEEARLRVTGRDGRIHHAWLYRAHASAVDAAAVPFRWYHELVLAGAREHGLPGHYIRRHIAGHPVRPDPDPDRADRHRALIPAGQVRDRVPWAG